MAITLLEIFETLINSEFIRTTARQLGESEQAVSTALSSGGTVLMARLTRTAHEAGAMARVATLVGGDEPAARTGTGGGTVLASTSASTSASLGAAATLGRGTTLLNVAFGPQLQAIVDALAAHAGIGQASARAVMGHAAPLVLKALGERLEDDDRIRAGLAPTGPRIAEVLRSERETILLGIPPVLLGALDKPIARAKPALAEAPTTTTTSRPSVTAAIAERLARAARPGGVAATRWELDGPDLGWPAVAGGLAGLALLWWLFLPGFYIPYSIRTTPSTATLSRTPIASGPPLTGPDTAAGGNFSTPMSATPSSKTVPAAVTGLLRFIKRTLPSSKQIEFAEDGVEGRMISLIENRGQPLERNQWFEFDRLQFHTGSSNLTSESRAQVQNIADILSSYPTARIKIGGYTDNVGDSAANQRLSEARAQRVMTELISLGISALRLEAEGYGELHPVGDNATSEGRARNRRTAVRVLER